MRYCSWQYAEPRCYDPWLVLCHRKPRHAPWLPDSYYCCTRNASKNAAKNKEFLHSMATGYFLFRGAVAEQLTNGVRKFVEGGGRRQNAPHPPPHSLLKISWETDSRALGATNRWFHLGQPPFLIQSRSSPNPLHHLSRRTLTALRDVHVHVAVAVTHARGPPAVLEHVDGDVVVIHTVSARVEAGEGEARGCVIVVAPPSFAGAGAALPCHDDRGRAKTDETDSAGAVWRR